MYLFDTSVLSACVNPQHPKHFAAQAFLQQHSGEENSFFISVITLSEINFGLHLLKTRGASAERIVEIERRVKAIEAIGRALEVTAHVARAHAVLRAQYAVHQCPNVVRGKLQKHVEMWHTDLPAVLLRITENDLWIAATAVTHDLVLVSADGEHADMAKAVPELKNMDI